MKKILLMITLAAISIVGCGDSSDLYAGTDISSKWDAQSVCQTARMMFKKRNGESAAKRLYSTKCTVEKLTGKLPARFSYYTPYAATWPNGTALRVFVTSEGLRMMGVSNDGVPLSWN